MELDNLPRCADIIVGQVVKPAADWQSALAGVRTRAAAVTNRRAGFHPAPLYRVSRDHTNS